MNRWIVLFALLMPNLSGCLTYAYPTLTYLPEVTVPNLTGNVRAYRVEIDQTQGKPQPFTQYTLAEIPVSSRGVIPSQFEVAAASGTYNPLGVIVGPAHERSEFTMLVRLYRPGQRTQEVKAWDKARELPWSPAPDLAGQEKAVDDLLAIPGQAPTVTWWDLRDVKTPGAGLQPGGVASGHAEALRFASNEYQRLANSPLANAPGAQAAFRDRLRSKSVWLRTLAERPADGR